MSTTFLVFRKESVETVQKNLFLYINKYRRRAQARVRALEAVMENRVEGGESCKGTMFFIYRIGEREGRAAPSEMFFKF